VNKRIRVQVAIGVRKDKTTCHRKFTREGFPDETRRGFSLLAKVVARRIWAQKAREKSFLSELGFASSTDV
jgi:hypothetical protein